MPSHCIHSRKLYRIRTRTETKLPTYVVLNSNIERKDVFRMLYRWESAAIGPLQGPQYRAYTH